MWRTVIVTEGEKITVENGNIRIVGKSADNSVPLADIYSVVIDNRAAMISVNVLSVLAEAGAHVYFCNEKHLPVSYAIPLNTHFQPLAVLKKQINLSESLKDELWKAIVERKIKNQALCLKYAGVDKKKAEEIEQISEAVVSGDKNGAEALAAKKYFSYLFGNSFIRRFDDVTNAALNYGYSIIRSSVCKTLVSYGFNCAIGLHHCSEQNEFNLADDVIEPFRPVVDLWVDENCDRLFEKLNK